MDREGKERGIPQLDGDELQGEVKRELSGIVIICC